ncbi:MAG: M23 family metallopeptidase, partial [Leptospirales bacterium]
VGRVSSSYGMRSDPFTRRQTFHGGLDIAAPRGTPVHASRGGKVIRVAGDAKGYGKLVVIEHKFGYKTYYGHLSAILVRKGQKVSADQIIGRVGATGRATGPHLHFEVRKNGQRKNPSVHGVRMR